MSNNTTKQSLRKLIENTDYSNRIEFYEDVKTYADRLSNIRLKYNTRHENDLKLLESDLRFYPFTLLCDKPLFKQLRATTTARLQQYLPKNNANEARN